MNKKDISILIASFTIIVHLNLFAQGSAIPLGNDAYHIIDRFEIKTGEPVPFVTGMKPYLRGDVIRYALMIDSSGFSISQKDRLDLYWLFKDNNEWLSQKESDRTIGERGKNEKTQMEMSFESDKYIERKPILKYFYKTPANGFELNKKFAHLRVNPVLNFKVFKDQHDEQWQFVNLRGAEIRGGVDDRVYFYTNIEETQARFAPYVTERIERDRAIMGAHLYKPYNSTVIKNLKNGYDYAISNAYLGFNVTRHIGMQFGHGNNFIGDGYRSLILSNNSANHLYWKINTRFRKFSYQNIFTQLTTANNEQDTLRRKYMVTHILNWKPFKNLDIAAFESIMIKPRGGDQFDFNYLNPIIFYRTVEYISGSNDNAMIGLQMKYNFLKRFSLYGQLFLDEFNMKELFALGGREKGWWANKYAYQIGLKYIDVLGINHLDAKIEHNLIRPYTYTHYKETGYWNARQPLAHPLGANLKETILNVRYQPTHRLVVDARLVNIITGEDSVLTRPYGQNVLSPYYKHPKEYGNFVGQGIATNILIAGLDVSYQFMQNMYAELHYFYRRKDSAMDSHDQTTHYIGAGIRANIANRRNDW